MAERLDTYLSREAQSADSSAVVVCVESPENGGGERWVLRRNAAPGQLAQVELGDQFDIVRKPFSCRPATNAPPETASE